MLRVSSGEIYVCIVGKRKPQNLLSRLPGMRLITVLEKASVASEWTVCASWHVESSFCFWSLLSKRELTLTFVSYFMNLQLPLRKWLRWLQGRRMYVGERDRLFSDLKDRILSREQQKEANVQTRPRGRWFSSQPFLISSSWLLAEDICPPTGAGVPNYSHHTVTIVNTCLRHRTWEEPQVGERRKCTTNVTILMTELVTSDNLLN